MSRIIHTTTDGLGLSVIDRTGTYDYEWSEFAVMRGTDGRLYVGATGGCSCNDFEENLGDEDIVQVKSWQDAARLAQLWAQGENYREEGSKDYVSKPYLEDEKRAGMDLVERLSKSQPISFDEAAVSGGVA